MSAEEKIVKKLSVVVPVYNEAEGIQIFYAMLDKELKKLPLESYEVVLVNDGSSDKTELELKNIAGKYPEATALNLTRNFGKEAALSAGLHQAKGECVVTLDADGQHPPEKISELLGIYLQGYDMVVGVRTENIDERSFKKLGNKMYYRLLKLIGISHLQPRVTDFRVMSRQVVDSFTVFTERRRITRGLLDWMGYNTAYVEFEAPGRLVGTATYSMKKLTYLAIDSILSNSRKPLAISIILGIFMMVTSMFGLFFVVIETYLLKDALNLNFTGTAVLILAALFMIGVLLISQGISSLYLARIYEETQQRPLYIIQSEKGIKKPKL
jgi:glycosyltransferase involved in cell wall biosynthesis